MRNIKLEIEYDGGNFAGWQCQSSQKVKARRQKTIQEAIEKVLRKILGERVRLIVSGRTDAGVHALAQVANFQTASTIALPKLQLALNGLLPKDISVAKIEEKSLDFHSRFHACSKIYRYTVLNRRYPSALCRKRVYFYPFPLDMELIRREAKVLLGRHDFRSFCASGSSSKDTVRTIKRLVIKRAPAPNTYHLTPNLLIIEIEADGFLYNMVRNIVGTLLEIGRGRFKSGSLKRILRQKDRRLAGPTAPSHGLCLMSVKY